MDSATVTVTSLPPLELLQVALLTCRVQPSHQPCMATAEGNYRAHNLHIVNPYLVVDG